MLQLSFFLLHFGLDIEWFLNSFLGNQEAYESIVNS